jgi:hypothetical protein
MHVLAAASGVPTRVIAIDGKTVRRSSHKRSGKAAIHMVSAFAEALAPASGLIPMTHQN